MAHHDLHRNTVNRVSRRTCLALFAINFLVLLIVYGRLLQPHLSPDYYAVYVNGVGEFAHHVRNGRIIYGIIFYIVESLGLRVTTCASLYTFAFMCTAAYCMMRVSTALCSSIKQSGLMHHLVCSLPLLIAVVNISMAEWYLFLEAMLMYSLALLFATEGALAFSRHDVSLGKRAAISFAALFISINCYQAMLSWYITLALMCVLSAADFKLSRETVIGGMTVMAVGGANAVLNQLIVRFAATLEFIGSASRHASLSIKGFAVNILKSIPTQISFLRNGFSLLPENFLIAAFCAGILMLLVSVCAKYRGDMGRRQAALIFLVFGVCYAFVYLPHFTSNNMAIAPRSIAGIFLVLGMLFAFAAILGTRWMQMLVLICVTGILAVSHVHISQIIDDHLLTSQRDLAEAQGIIRAIDAHEQAGGEPIAEVCVLQDRNPYYYYPDVAKRVMDINLRQMVVDWEQVNILTALSGRTFEHIYVSEEEAEAIVQGRNWNELNLEEQLVFDGSTLYIITF